MPLLALPDGQLEYETAGAGRPACFTHQYTGVSVAHPLAEMLTPLFTCYAINARGIGASGPVRGPADLGMIGLADDLEAARLALKLPRWVVVGASTGGMVALQYATRHPAGLAGLILVGTAASQRFVQGSIYEPGHPRAEEMNRARAALATGTPEGMAEWRRVVWSLSVLDVEHTPRPAGMRSAFSLERLQGFTRDLPAFDLEPLLGQIRVPTLILVGRHDPQCPLENSERMAAAIPGARLVICEHSGHFPYLEEPEVARPALEEFAQRLGA
ncbi:MAG TPA: alpha/beta hydrolase [Ktedonobacterales bacterium]|jgi:proline iminopeptidase